MGACCRMCMLQDYVPKKIQNYTDCGKLFLAASGSLSCICLAVTALRPEGLVEELQRGIELCK